MNGDASPAALAANRRLLEIRRQLAEERAAGRSQVADREAHGTPVKKPPVSEQGGKKNGSHSDSFLSLSLPSQPLQPVDFLAGLPPHLGWGSETLTAHLRKLRNKNDELRVGAAPDAAAYPFRAWGDTPSAPLLLAAAGLEEQTGCKLLDSSLATRHSSLVKVYPDIALGMLRRERAAAGRVWLMLRYLDGAGRGWLALAEARAALCGQRSPLRLCGWRRLRQLLTEGEGLFWTRDGRGRLWMRGPARVAAGLAVRRLIQRPVGMPVGALLGSIGDVRAHLYAAFHSGRAKEATNCDLQATNAEGDSSLIIRHSSLGMPISRDTLAKLSGVCPRSQSGYERRTGVVSRMNMAVGERVAAGGDIGPREQERAWRQGRGLFRLKDYRGRFGQAGATYLAWRLPNGYSSACGHQRRPKGRQKRINRQLADLFTKGMTGNGERIVKRFYGTAAAAMKAMASDELQITNGGSARSSPAGARYWSNRVGQGPGLWAVVEAT